MKMPPLPRDPVLDYVQTALATRLARMRADGERGASAIELAIITAVLVGLAVVILGIIVKFATTQGNNITNTNVPNPGGN
jgi:Flp pilus assembly pilin Flp